MDLDEASSSGTQDETTERQVLAAVRQLLIEVIGEQYAIGLEIEMETSINSDLELESIEFVKLASRLSDYYGDRVNFVAFLAEREVDDLVKLTVGQIVHFIAGRLQASTVTANNG